jgi:hypothetical protein
MVALDIGNRMVRISAAPFGFFRGVPSASTTRTCAPSQLACREPEDAGRRVEDLIARIRLEIGRRHGANGALAETPGGGGIRLRDLLLHLHEHFQRHLVAADALRQQRPVQPVLDQRRRHLWRQPPRPFDLVGFARDQRLQRAGALDQIEAGKLVHDGVSPVYRSIICGHGGASACADQAVSRALGMIRKSAKRFSEKDHAQTRAQSAKPIEPKLVAL